MRYLFELITLDFLNSDDEYCFTCHYVETPREALCSKQLNSTSEQLFAYNEVKSALDCCVAIRQGGYPSYCDSVITNQIHMNCLLEENAVCCALIFIYCNYSDITTVRASGVCEV